MCNGGMELQTFPRGFHVQIYPGRRHTEARRTHLGCDLDKKALRGRRWGAVASFGFPLTV